MQVDYWTPTIFDFPEFERDEVQVFIEAFEEYDKDHSGNIDKNELEEALKAMGQGITKVELDQLFTLFDVDKSGYIDWVEWLGIMRYLYPWKIIEFKQKYLEPAKRYPEFSKTDIFTFVAAFREFDLDGSGAIDAHELEIAFKKMGQGCTPEELRDLIAEFDVDMSGAIEWDEFLAIMRFFYADKLDQYRAKFIEPAKLFPEFSRLEIAVFVDAFHEYDTNGNGTIDSTELQLVFAAMGHSALPAEVSRIMGIVDPKRTGELNFEQFLGVMRIIYSEKKAEVERVYYEPAKKFPEFSREEIQHLIESFREFDLDGDGVIDVDELWVAFRVFGLEIPKEAVTAILTEFDANKNGVIEWPEYLAMMRKLQGREPVAQQQQQQPKAPAPSAPQPVAKTTSSTPSPAPASKQQEKKPSTWVSKTPSMKGFAAPSSKCELCKKTVYSMEAVTAIDKIWHKACFKCSDASCGVVLNLQSYKASGGAIYCAKHVPAQKPSVGANSLALSGAMNAPKTQRVQGVKRDKRMTFAPGVITPDQFK